MNSSIEAKPPPEKGEGRARDDYPAPDEPSHHREGTMTEDQLYQQARTDVVSSSLIECACRWHAGACVVEHFADGTMRHIETLPAPWGDNCEAQTRVHVMTPMGMRYR